MAGECVTIQPLYRDRRGLGWRSVSQYTPLYCDKLRAGLMAGRLCRNTPNCIVIRAEASWGRVCHDTNFVS